MTSEQRNALTTPIKLALGAALGIVGSVVMFTWSASAAWSQTTQKVEDVSQRVTKLETSDAAQNGQYIGLREAIVTLNVQMKNLTDAVQTVGKDVKDIRTAVK